MIRMHFNQFPWLTWQSLGRSFRVPQVNPGWVREVGQPTDSPPPAVTHLLVCMLCHRPFASLPLSGHRQCLSTTKPYLCPAPTRLGEAFATRAPLWGLDTRSCPRPGHCFTPPPLGCCWSTFGGNSNELCGGFCQNPASGFCHQEQLLLRSSCG